MSVLPGFGDLKPRDVVLFANGTAMVDMGNKIEMFQIQVSPTGCFQARPLDKDKPLDQQGQRRVLSREQRLAMTDQGQALLGG